MTRLRPLDYDEPSTLIDFQAVTVVP
jgi:hypothetical protein